MLIYRKLLMTISLCFVFSALFSIVNYANEVETKDVLEYFDLSNYELGEMVRVNESTSFVAPVYNLGESYTESLKDMGALKLTTGFIRERTTTFSSYKNIAGVGNDKVVVGIYVFHFENPTDYRNKKLVGTQDQITEIGASGLYNETIYFDYVGINYVLLAVYDGKTNTEEFRLFKVTRKKVETRDILENIQIDFYEKDTDCPKLEEYMPNIGNYGF